MHLADRYQAQLELVGSTVQQAAFASRTMAEAMSLVVDSETVLKARRQHEQKAARQQKSPELRRRRRLLATARWSSWSWRPPSC